MGLIEAALVAYVCVTMALIWCHSAATDELWRMFQESPQVIMWAEFHPHAAPYAICAMVALTVFLRCLAWPFWPALRWKEKRRVER